MSGGDALASDEPGYDANCNSIKGGWRVQDVAGGVTATLVAVAAGGAVVRMALATIPCGPCEEEAMANRIDSSKVFFSQQQPEACKTQMQNALSIPILV